MAVLKYKDAKKMSEKDREEKLKELKFGLIKNRVSSSTKTKNKEIKKAVARILTFNRINRSADKK
jgi:ribosomal protein L29